MNQAMTCEGISNKYTTNTTVSGYDTFADPHSVQPCFTHLIHSCMFYPFFFFGLHHYGSLYSGWSNASAHESYFLSTELNGISSHHFLDKLANLPHLMASLRCVPTLLTNEVVRDCLLFVSIGFSLCLTCKWLCIWLVFLWDLLKRLSSAAV